jgi:uncharacterized protein involved in outer membrane biogenesis
MKKWILIGGAVVIIIIIVALVIGILNIGPIIKTAVNTYGPKITKTDLRLDDVGISILSGKLKLKGFYLGNPKGFKSPEAMKVKSIYIAIDKKSLTKDPIIINTIEIARPEITYEKALSTDNFNKIIDNVNKSVGMDKAPKEKTTETGEGKKLLIRDLIIKEGKVNLATSLPIGKNIGAALPDIHLKNIGGEKEGASPAKVAEEILTALYSKITSPDVTKALNEELKAVSKDTQKQLEGAAGSAVKGASKELEGAAGKASKGLFGK